MLKRQSSFKDESPKLYLVGTPIGNYQDMTFRAIEVLKKVDYIYCEDTRITGQLLKEFDIHTKMRSYNVVTENDLTKSLVDEIKNGNNIAVVTDAGMPGISDPGFFACREAIKDDIDVVVIPGVSASLTALVGSGLASRNFYFAGFLGSKKSERIKNLDEIKDYTNSLIIYEAPHRISDTLNDIKEVLGNRNIVLCRELTKKYEEYLRGTVEEILEVVDELKGEMVLIVEGAKESTQTTKLNSLSIKEHFDFYINAGLDEKEAMKKVAQDRKVSKSIIYKEIKC